VDRRAETVVRPATRPCAVRGDLPVASGGVPPAQGRPGEARREDRRLRKSHLGHRLHPPPRWQPTAGLVPRARHPRPAPPGARPCRHTPRHAGSGTRCGCPSAPERVPHPATQTSRDPPLGRGRGLHRPLSGRKHHIEAVAFGAQLGSPMVGPRFALHLTLPIHRLRVLRTQPLQQQRGPLHVGEQQGNRSRRQSVHEPITDPMAAGTPQLSAA